MPKVYAISQKAAESFKPPKDCALISIATPIDCGTQYPQPNLINWNANPILQLCFHDTEPNKHGEDFVHMSEQDAKLIIMFAKANLKHDIYVHCFAGVSRSNATVRALNELFGFQIGSTASEHLANKYVWRLITDTFHKANNDT